MCNYLNRYVPRHVESARPLKNTKNSLKELFLFINNFVSAGNPNPHPVNVSGALSSQNCLQWGRSNLVDPAESPKICLLNRDLGNILSIFPRKKQQNTEFTKFSLVQRKTKGQQLKGNN